MGLHPIDGVLFDKGKTLLIQYPTGQTNISYTIPDSVTKIGWYAFSSCTSLSSITIPDSVTSIGDTAFGNCTSLTSITIPDSVISIGRSAFSSCTGLTSISVATANPAYSSIDGVLFDKEKTILIQYPTGQTNMSYTIPDSVTSIGDSAFSSCTSLISITVPDNVTSIGYSAFENCNSLTSIKFKGNGPISASESVFLNATPTIYRLSTATGWGDTFAGRPVELWNE